MRKVLKGSFTIEASIIVPFVLFLMIMVLEIGIHFYQESISRQPMHELQKIDTISTFYHLQMVQELGKELKDGGE